MNTWWRIDNAIVGYTEDRSLMRSISRYYKDYSVMAEYYTFNGKLFAKQYKI